jgi:hypothetical protein
LHQTSSGTILACITATQPKISMKNRLIAGTLGLLFVSFTLSAQVVSKDSIKALNEQKDLIAANKKLNDRKIELAKLDLATFVSNTFEMEWPPKSGKMKSYPENDKAAWLKLGDAKMLINEKQLAFLEELAEILDYRPEH